MQNESKKQHCQNCGEETTQLNLDRKIRKWVCNECFFENEKETQKGLQR